ncbi:unnamed protein product, partial [Laminaria digitata]
ARRGGGRGGILEQRMNHVPTRVTVDFGNSPLVHQHLSLLTRGEAPSVTPIRLKVTREARRTLRPFQEIGLRLAEDKTVRSDAWRAAQAVRMREQRPATADILERVEKRREALLRQHASSKRETRREIVRMRSDAAEDRCIIQAEAAGLFSKGDVHEFSNFLARERGKKQRDNDRDQPAAGGGGGA